MGSASITRLVVVLIVPTEVMGSPRTQLAQSAHQLQSFTTKSPLLFGVCITVNPAIYSPVGLPGLHLALLLKI